MGGEPTHGQERSYCPQWSSIQCFKKHAVKCAEAKVLHGAKVAFALQVGGETLPQVSLDLVHK